MAIQNPFENLDVRLARIEDCLSQISEKLQSVEQSSCDDRDFPIDIHQAAKFVDLSTSTIYSKVSKRQIFGYD